MTRAVCYRSFEHKRTEYVARTLPAIFSAALDGMQLFRAEPPTLELMRRLHDEVRAMEYAPEAEPKGLAQHCDADHKAIDEVQAVARTLGEGGDCEDYAALLLAALWAMGFPAGIETAGDAQDPFQHVRVIASLPGDARTFILDPKPDPAGVDFGERWRAAELPLWQTFTYQPEAVAHG